MATNNAINQQGPTPAFSVYTNGFIAGFSGSLIETAVPFDVILFDTTSSYNATTFTYVVPVTGTYLFTANMFMCRLGASNTLMYSNIGNVGKASYTICNINPYVAGSYDSGTNTWNYSIVGTVLCNCTAADKVQATVAVNGSAITVYAAATDFRTCFSGYLITQV